MTKMFLAAVSLIAAAVPAFADEECWPVKKTVWTLDGTAMLVEKRVVPRKITPTS